MRGKGSPRVWTKRPRRKRQELAFAHQQGLSVKTSYFACTCRHPTTLTALKKCGYLPRVTTYSRTLHNQTPRMAPGKLNSVVDTAVAQRHCRRERTRHVFLRECTNLTASSSSALLWLTPPLHRKAVQAPLPRPPPQPIQTECGSHLSGGTYDDIGCGIFLTEHNTISPCTDIEIEHPYRVGAIGTGGARGHTFTLYTCHCQTATNVFFCYSPRPQVLCSHVHYSCDRTMECKYGSEVESNRHCCPPDLLCFVKELGNTTMKSSYCLLVTVYLLESRRARGFELFATARSQQENNKTICR